MKDAATKDDIMALFEQLTDPKQAEALARLAALADEYDAIAV